MIPTRFMEIASAAVDTHTIHSGTEHVAFLLYTLARMNRPRVVVEYGSGYTTLFLLLALSQNAIDHLAESQALREKTPAPSDLAALEGRQPYQQWLTKSGKACAADPAHYLTPHAPRLYSFDEKPLNDPYAQRLVQAAETLQLSDLLDYHTGGKFDLHSMPATARPIDLAWNDHDEYRPFFSAVWPKLNPAGGMLAFHNTAAHKSTWESIQWMKRQRRWFNDLEVLTLTEPHKLWQNGCTILRRTSDYRPMYHSASRDRVLADAARFAARQERTGPSVKGGDGP